MEIWAGIECTINRVGDQFNDQCKLLGHWLRNEDLDHIRDLGVQKLRYPILWENIAPHSLDGCDFSKVDVKLQQLRDHGIEPIVGLVHHGSGPSYTSLLDPEFPEKLARYARIVAERYPWLNIYTPINEPLTTARFSGLYGEWYPHHRSLDSFFKMLVNQIRAGILAIREIRAVNPNAQLLFTEDMGKTLSTSKLKYQAEYENERRWLSLDFAFGRVNREHYFYPHLIANGITSEQIRWVAEHATVPDVVGINHYLLSTRYLDHRLDIYPKHTHGGNGIDRYADVGAVDTGQAAPAPPKQIFCEAWERYRAPMVISEVFTGGGREAQMRWLKEVYDAAHELRKEGADIRAITPWSLLGNYDWISLCTRSDGHYEAGAFDIRSRRPRPTALAGMIRDMAENRAPDHPLLKRKGYWHEPQRILYAPCDSGEWSRARPKSQPLAITGATGTLGQAFARVCERRGIDYVLLSRRELDIASEDSVRETLRHIAPWAVINAAGYVRVDDAEADCERCLRENVAGPKNLAEFCANSKIPLLTFSSDLVFNGERKEPYRESHPVAPLNVYGTSKAEAEKCVLSIHPQALVIRTSAFFGPWDRYNFIRQIQETLKDKKEMQVADDAIVSPTYVPDLVWASLDLLADGEKGLLHLANRGSISWAEWARWVAEQAGIDRDRIVGCSVNQMSWPARRPRYSVLESERVAIMPSLEHALNRYKKEVSA